MKRLIEIIKEQIIKTDNELTQLEEMDQFMQWPKVRLPEVRAERKLLERLLMKAAALDNEFPADSLQEGRKKIVCYCGSLRVALDAFKKAEYESIFKGEIALLPCCMFVDIQREYGANSNYKISADELHKRKIDIADEVFVLNVNGYIGESTRSEIDYAIKIGKPVKYLEPIS